MPTDKEEEIQDRLKEHSVKISGEITKQALLDLRLTSLEEIAEKYHLRLHDVENQVIVMKVVQDIHEVQISSYRKALQGNGDKESIPMDIARIENSIQNILKVDWVAIRSDIDRLKVVEARQWQIWILVIGSLIANLVQWFMR